MADIFFLKALRDKLKGGNTRSIHLNALPGRFATRLDLANLNYISPGTSEKFLTQLFSNACFDFKISFDGIDMNTAPADVRNQLGALSKRLNAITIENEDNFKELGIKTFGFGFPILIKPSRQDPSKIIKAPLFIWHLEILKSPNKVNTWSILRNKVRNDNGKVVDQEVHAVGLNEVLLSFIKSDENIMIPSINEELLEDAIIDRKELIDECVNFLKALNPSVPADIKDTLDKKLDNPLLNIPDNATLDAATNNLPWIHFGGVFGLYRTQKESIITDIDKLIDNFDTFDFETRENEIVSGTPHSAIDTDPSQQEILTNLSADPKKIIQGPPGTGKSQSLTALVTNALANNLKCLVVCEKKTALDVIKNNLYRENEELGGLTAVIEDINRDRDLIVNSVRDRLANLADMPAFNQTRYKTVKDTVETKAAEINNQHKLLDRAIYMGRPWTELVGEFLKRYKSADSDLLKQKLDPRQFRFMDDSNELPDLVSKIRQAKKLYADINTTNHPLDSLNDSVFKEENQSVLQLHLLKLTHDTNEALKNAEPALKAQTEAYKKWIDEHFSNYYNTLKKEVNAYNELVSVNEAKYGDLLFKNDSFTKIRIDTLSHLSGNYKELKEARLNMINRLPVIKQAHQTLNYFQHIYIDDTEQATLKVFAENIAKLGEDADNWYRNIENLKAGYVQAFSFNSMHPLYKPETNLKQAEDDFNSAIAILKNEQLLKKPLPDTATHVGKLSLINTVCPDLQLIYNNLQDYRSYFTWRKYYIGLTPVEKTVIHTLIDLNCSDWELTFECWYYQWLLSIAETELKGLPQSDDKISELIESKGQLKKLQIKSILNTWSVKQAQTAKAAATAGINPVTLYNKRGSKGEKRNSLRKIINTDFQLFTDFFPVLMLSPSVCSAIIPLKEKIFDLVIFDEASQLRLEDTFPALVRGKVKIVSGDSQQMPPSNFFQGGTTILNPTDDDEDDDITNTAAAISGQAKSNAIDLADSESLLVYAENSSYRQSYLKIHYRSQHPHLIDFSNHAFYGKRLIPMPARTDYQPIEFIAVNGIYEDQVNPDEARQVVDILLHQIKPLKNGTYPTVGVATFNLYQRNLILEEITKARQQKAEYDKKINDLGPDFFVKNLENIQGDERDIIILSTTFGKKKDGTFRQNFGPVLQANGYKLLNVIVTRAKYKIYVCTSIPQELYDSCLPLLQQMKNNGRAIFYSYLAYAKSVSEKNHAVRESILQQLYENCDSRVIENDQTLGSESPFEEEVYTRLAALIGENRLIQQYRVGGFKIDIVVKSGKSYKPVIAIECDGAKYHSSNEAYAWDMFRQSQLEKQGFIFYRIWSANWWHSPDKELKKLVDFILSYDVQEPPPIIPLTDNTVAAN